MHFTRPPYPKTMKSRYSLATGILFWLNISSAHCQEAEIENSPIKSATPALRPRRLRHNNFNGRHVDTDSAWHRLAQEDIDHGDAVNPDDAVDGGSDFVDLLRQTNPQYVIQQHQDAFDEMLTRAFSDISVGFNSLPPQTAAPTTIGDPSQSRNRTDVPTASPTPLGIRAENDVVVTSQDTPVDINVLGNDSYSATNNDNESINTDTGDALTIPSAPALIVGNYSKPLHGEATLNSDSTIRYTPSAGYSNCPDPDCFPIVPLDCFEYQVCGVVADSLPSSCAWANVCVEVTKTATSPPSPAPTTASPTAGPTTASPTLSPTTASPTLSPTLAPTLPCDMTAEDRAEEILFTLVDISSPALLSDPTTPQGRAFRWLVDEDAFYVCPSDNTCDVVQRFVLAVVYFSTNGEAWFQCSGNRAASDDCGNDFPFDQGQSRFLAPVSECNWAGIRCSEDLCVTDIEFELNNLVGTIPNEIGNLPFLEVLGMERGGLSSTIPSVLGQLTNLYFLDLDYNTLSGTIPSEISSLTALEQLDLNNNRLTGGIDAIAPLTNIFFLQLHNNFFSGTIPERLGGFTELGAATLHSNQFVGSISPQICALRDSFGGPLMTLTTDCGPPESPEITCTCCTECRSDSI